MIPPVVGWRCPRGCSRPLFSSEEGGDSDRSSDKRRGRKRSRSPTRSEWDKFSSWGKSDDEFDGNADQPWYKGEDDQDGTEKGQNTDVETPPQTEARPMSPRTEKPRRSPGGPKRSRSPRRTETSHEAAAQAASPADSSGAAAFGAEVVPDAPSHFGRAPQPDSFADINERHDIKTGQVPFDQRKKTSAARGGDETDGGDEMGKGQGNHCSGLYDRDGNPLHIYGDGNPIHIFSSVQAMQDSGCSIGIVRCRRAACRQCRLQALVARAHFARDRGG